MTIPELTNHHGLALADLNLSGNAGSPLHASELAWLPSLPASASDAKLRHELATKGVVHVRGVMPREYVLETRGKYFAFMSPTGILAPDSDPRDGLWAGDREPNDFVPPASAGYIDADQHPGAAAAALERAWKVVDEQWSKDFCANEYIRDMVARLRPDWTCPFVFTRQIWRTNIPGAKGTSTGVHYDHIFLRGGPPTALTAWVPVGDCDPRMGGLMYLSDSVPLGAALEAGFSAQSRTRGFSEDEARSAFNSNMDKTGMLSLDPAGFVRDHNGSDTAGDGRQRKWLIGDYAAGDVVFHLPLMVHASTANEDPAGRIRLSTDLRYGDRLHAYDARWDRAPHRPNDGL